MTEMETTITSTTALLKIWKDFNLAYVLVLTFSHFLSFFFNSNISFSDSHKLNPLKCWMPAIPWSVIAYTWMRTAIWCYFYSHTHSYGVRLYEMLIVLSCLVNFSTGTKSTHSTAQTIPFIEPYREVCNWYLMSTLFYLISNFLLNWNYLP